MIIIIRTSAAQQWRNGAKSTKEGRFDANYFKNKDNKTFDFYHQPPLGLKGQLKDALMQKIKNYQWKQI